MSEFLSVIEWFEKTGEDIFYRIPQEGSAETKIGSQLIVLESQEAAFIRDGKVYDIFRSGRHTLTTYNIPLFTKALSFPFKFKSPFRVVVYFVNKKVFILKWGTKNPITFKDKIFEMIRLRAFGSYSLKITDSRRALNTLVGSMNLYTTFQVRDFVNNFIVMKLNQLLSTVLESILALPIIYDQIAKGVVELLNKDLKVYGIALEHLIINSISPPEEVAKKIDEKSSMQAIGDLDKYLKYNLAEAIKNISEMKDESNTSSAASLGLGAGTGIALAQAIKDTLNVKNDKIQSDDIESRLKKLKSLFEEGLISEGEYEQKKRQIINNL